VIDKVVVIYLAPIGIKHGPWRTFRLFRKLS